MKPWEERDSTPFSLWQDGEKIATFEWERAWQARARQEEEEK